MLQTIPRVPVSSSQAQTSKEHNGGYCMVETRHTRHMGDATEVKFLDLTLHPRVLAELNALVEEGIGAGRKWIIAHHNLHSLYLLHRQPKLREFYAHAHWTPIDGMPRSEEHTS